MKTQLIQLDSSDDVISVRDRMGWSQTSRILLVWPENGGVLSRRLDLVLLQRHSSRLGAQLALVTQSAVVREIAQELRIPVFIDARQAQNTRWRTRRRPPTHPRRQSNAPDVGNLRLEHQPHKPGWQERPIARYSLFGLSMLAILALISLLIPAAIITLQPETHLQSITVPVRANTRFAAVNLAGEIPAGLQSVVVEGRASLLTTGSMLIPGEAAIGAVTLTNLTTRAVRVPQGLIISTLEASPIRFITTKAGVVSAGPGRTLTLPVQALVPGKTGNLDPGSLAAIEGNLGLSISVTNPYATHGGKDVSAPAPNDSDRQRLLRQLTATLSDSALADLESSLADGDLLISTSLLIVDTLEETYTPANGLPGDDLALTLRLEYQAMVVRQGDLRALAVPVLDGSLEAGFEAVPDTLTLRHTAFAEADEQGSVTWKLTAQRSLRADISSEDAIQLVAGQPAETATRLLKSRLALVEDAQVELKPAWWPTLPYLPFRIQVITE